MNATIIPPAAPAGDMPRPLAAFPRYTIRDLLIEVFYHKRIMAIAFIVPVLLGLAAASITKPAYVAQARLLVLYGSEYFYRPVTGQSTNSSIPLDRNEIMLGELQVLQSQTLANQTLQAVGLQRVYPGLDPADPAALPQGAMRFEKDLSATSIAQSNVLELSFRSHDADVAADVLRALIKGYIERRAAVFAHPSSPTAQSDQESFQERLHAAEGAVARFADQHGIGNFDQQMTLLLTMQSANRGARDDGAQAIGQTAAKLAMVQAQAPKVPGTIQLSAESDRSQHAQLLTAELTQLQVKRRELLTRYQPGTAAVQDADRDIAAIQSQMAQGAGRESGIIHDGRNPVAQDLQSLALALQSELAGLKAKQAELDTTAGSIAARLAEFNGIAQTYRDLQRNRDVLDETYRALVRSNEDAQIADAAERSRAANIRVVQPPERPAAGRSLGTILAVAGVAVGLGAAVAALAVTYALRQVFVSVRDVTVTLDLPVLVGVARRRGGRTLLGAIAERRLPKWRKHSMPGTQSA